MNTNKGAAERRRFYRIEDDIALSFRVLEGTEVDAAMRRFTGETEDTIALAATFSATSDEMRRGLEAVKRHMPEVASYLEGLNTKLDILARLLINQDIGLPSQPTHLVDLSAGGISFNAEMAVPAGSLLELKLGLFPSHVFITSLGAVVTCTPRPGAEDGQPFRLGVDFSYIREADRELLVKHVVQKQSRSLREARPTED